VAAQKGDGLDARPGQGAHLPDPAEAAAERFGTDRAAELLAKGEASSIDDVVARVLAMPSPAA
jgi:hypothetical protein